MPTPEDLPILAHGVVANVRAEIARGEGGLDIRRGTKHFAPGAKVWILPTHWGDGGERVIVLGRHRGNSVRYVKMILERRLLENFRVRGIYSPALMAAMERPMRKFGPTNPLWRDQDTAERVVERWSKPMTQAFFDRQHHRSAAMVSDPPPAELEHDGRTYYLAHFNDRRAWYSSELPPIEAS